jgi:hypothetical protein
LKINDKEYVSPQYALFRMTVDDDSSAAGNSIETWNTIPKIFYNLSDLTSDGTNFTMTNGVWVITFYTGVDGLSAAGYIYFYFRNASGTIYTEPSISILRNYNTTGNSDPAEHPVQMLLNALSSTQTLNVYSTSNGTPTIKKDYTQITFLRIG